MFRVWTLAWSTPRKKSIDFLGIRWYNKSPGTKKVLKYSIPILGRVQGLGLGFGGVGFRGVGFRACS